MNKEVEKDIEIIQRSLMGNIGAFSILVERYLNAVYKFAYYYVRDYMEAEDITQETFMRAWKHLKKFDQKKNFKTWLFAIAKNASLDFIKKKKPLLFSHMAENDDELESLLAPYFEEGELPAHAIDREMSKN